MLFRTQLWSKFLTAPHLSCSTLHANSPRRSAIRVAVADCLVWCRVMHRGAAVEQTRREHAALAAPADQQHAWVLAGDDRGIYGEYPPKQIAIDAGSIAYQRLCTSETLFGPWDL